ncbi:MAG: hypothetical protein QOD42_2748, partial [Sphingomonadales bacterium]|nr:hypothetical protein [Sphingomonadales bacterium]
MADTPTLNPEIKKMFDDVRAQLVEDNRLDRPPSTAVTPRRDIAAFDKRIALFMTNPDAIKRLNDLYDNKLLFGMEVDPLSDGIAHYAWKNKYGEEKPAIAYAPFLFGWSNDVTPITTIFHEVSHGETHYESEAKANSLYASLKTMILETPADVKPDVTSFMIDYLKNQLYYEAKADMDALNTYLSGPHPKNDPIELAGILQSFGRLVDPITGEPLSALRAADGKFKTDPASYSAAATLLMKNGPWNEIYLGYTLTRVCMEAKGRPVTIDTSLLRAAGVTMTFENLMKRVNDFWAGPTNICIVEDKATPGVTAEVTAVGGMTRLTLKKPTGTTELRTWPTTNVIGSSFRAEHVPPAVGIWLSPDGKPISLELSGPDGPRTIDISKLLPEDQKRLTDLLRAGERVPPEGLNVVDPTSGQVTFEGGYLRIKFPKGTRTDKGVRKDKFGRDLYILIDSEGNTVKSIAIEAGVRVTKTYDAQQKVVDTKIEVRLGELINFSNAGGVLGQQLGYLLAGDNKIAGVVASASLQTIGRSLGEVLDKALEGMSVKKAVDGAFKNFGDNFLKNLKSAGIGAVSSFLTAELVHALDIGGMPGELLNTAAGSVINTIITNIVIEGAKTAAEIFNGVGSAATLGTAIGSYIGNKLASQIVTFGSIGGQIGSAVGSILGSIAGAAIGKAVFGSLGTALAGPLGAAIGAFVGTLLGGAIGSLLGGTPRSGADVQWDETGGEFVTANVYSRKGGAEEAARGMATAVAQTFNNILSATGGTLMNPELIQAGNYGTRKADYVYRPASTRDKDAITQRFSGKDAAQRLIGYGLFQGLTDPDFKIVGGDVYVKRALYNTFENGGLDPLNFDASVILGNITFAQRYEAYTQNSLWMNSLISAEPDSVLAAETALTLAKAVELGLTRRHEADWYGGFSYLLQDLDVGAGEISFGFYYDPFADRLGRSINSRGFDLGDSIDVAGQTSIAGTAGADTIRLSSDQLLATSGTTNERLVVDDQAFDGSALTIDVAATIEAGDGDDFVQASDRGDNVLGGGGNDTLYGGRLDDWLLGGEGNDKLYAGNEAGSLGGDGNYLDGGAGNDELYGREGSDWLEGGEGTDALDGGGGDDILAGGAGVNDTLKGGHGDDQYLVRLGDGADTADEVASGTIVDAPAAADQIRARFAAINQPGALRNWAGDGGDFIKADLINALIAKARAANPAAPVAPPALAAVDAGGEDAIVFGQGIGMGDVRMMRVDDGSVRTDAGRNLLIQVMRINPATNMPEPSGTQMLVKDWFVDTLKRVEWLKFADGNEIRIADIRTFIVGGPGDDILNGTDENDFVYGDAGNDYIKLYRGDDIGSGATGDDAIFGDEDDDLLIGGLGEDKLFGGADNDVLTGDGGNDELTGDAGNDLLSGGRGDDVLSGGAGIDTIKFSRGDGRDTILANVAAPGASGGYWEEVWTNTGGEIDREPLPSGGGWGQNVRREKSVDNTTTKVLRWVPVPGTPAQAGSGDDTIEFGLGINIQDIVFTLAGDDLVLAVSQENAELTSAAAAADTITIRAWNGARPISKVAFYQTGIIDVGTGTAGTKIIAGTDGDDTIDGGNTAEWITGGAGGDTLTGNGGDDILNGNNGLDTLFGGAGKDVLYGGSGNDILVGGAEADILIGGTGSDTASYAGSGSVWASLAFSSANTGDAKGDEYSGIEDLTGSTGDDVLIGDSDQNTLDGGTGSDTLRGYEGDDVYIWNGNAGAAGSIPASNIQEGAGFFQEVMSSGGTLNSSYRVQFTVTDQTWISEEGNAPTGPTLDDEVGTPDGRGHYEYTLRKEIIGSNGELVYGMEGLTSLTESPAAAAFGYQDHGWAAGYAPTLEGQQVGFLGLDPTKDSGSDTLELREGIGLADLSFAWSGNDLVITRTGNGSTMTMRDQKLAGGRVEFLQFEDGLTVNLANLVLAANGAAADDFIVGDVARNVMHGNGGHDVVSGGAGNDDLYGDGGDDILEGGEGGDLLDGGANSRQPDNDNSNDATQGESVTWGDTARYAGSKVRVKVDLGPGGVQLEGDAQGDTLINIENVTGSRFGDVLLGNDGGNRINGLDGLNTIKGLGGDDVLVGGADKDWLDGGAGVDDIVGGGGDDDLWGGLGDDRLHGDAGNDWIRGDEGADTLMGGDGRDVLEGGDGDDQLIGGAGELDTLRGGKGNDLLIGEGGADTLEGGEGNDQYYFGASSGQDTVSDASGANTIMFGDNVAFDKLWLTKDGSNLKIAVIGTSDVVMVQGYFLATSSIRSVRTAGHILFLDNADARSMINQMTAKSAATPGAMPVDLAAVLPSNWHAGDKAAPTARTTPLAVELEEDTSKTIAGDYQVVDHDSGGALTYTLSSDAGPLHGTVEIKNAATGEIVYTPDTDFNGTDSFSLVVIDADKQSALIPITVTVTPVDDRPTLQVLNPGAGLISEQTGDWVAQFQIAGGAGATAELEFTINPGGLFKTDGSNVRFVGVPDFETLLKANPGFVVEDGDGDGLDEIVLKGQVRAVAGVNASEPQDFLVRVEDVNEAATGLALGNKAASILERDNLGGTSPSRPAIVLGEVSVADGDIVILPDGRDVSRKTGQHDFKVFENGSTAQSTRFAVIGGELRLLDGKSLDYETDGTAITLRVVATDRSSAPRSIEQLFSFAIVDQVDVFEGDASNNILTGQNGADLIRGLAGNDTLGGGLGNDNLEGGLGNDTLDGGLGADMMAGGAGDDIYMADTGDTVTELNGEGTDLVITALGSYSLALNANVENLKYMGNASFTGTGNDLYNVITGGDGNDTLNGGAGYDVLYGGAGDDTLDGGLGEYDTLVGGTGNDTYVVDSIYDTVTEQQNEGADTVKTAIGSYTLGANVEKLTYTGNASFTGT